MAFVPSDQSLSQILVAYSFPLALSNHGALLVYLSLSGCTAKPSVKYAERITTSPQLAGDVFQLQPTSHFATDNDHDGYHSPSHSTPQRSASEPPYGHEPGSYTSSQSFRRRMTYGGWGAKPERPVNINKKNFSASTVSLVQSVKTKVSNLFVPGHKVGKAPGFLLELRTIVFGSCTSIRPICFRAYLVF